MASKAALPCDLNLFPPNARVLVAVSGGADSLALLLALREAKLPLVAGHINHGLRGVESDGDEDFFLQLCAAHNIEAYSQRVQLTGISEETARQARYQALCLMAQAQDCMVIATGHTADDSLETILMNWLRGAAVAGLAGIPARRVLDNCLILVRPLLGTTREATRAFCRAANWTWREDSSNESEVYTRNRVRALLPQLAAAARVTPEQLARQTTRAAALWREDNEFLDEIAREKLEMLTLERTPELLVLNGVRFAHLPPPQGRRVLRLAAQVLHPEAREIGSEPVELARRHITDAGRHAVWNWPGGINLEWTGPQSGNRIRMRFVRQKTSSSGTL